MGCCGSSDENTQHINKFMNKAESADMKVFKLLLLGPGSTGKSTLFKSLRISYSGDFQAKEKRNVLVFVRQNVVFGIHTLLEQTEVLFNSDNEKYAECKIKEISPELQGMIELIAKYYRQTGYMDDTRMDLDFEELAQLAQAIEFVWNLPAIQATFRFRANKFVFDDNLDYFFGKVKEVFTQAYLPSSEDCLKNRIKTTGMTQYEYQPPDAQSNKFNIVDVGGQRAERAKWINYFDNVHALLYVASLIDYNSLLYEDETINCMAESCQLFDDTTKLDTFKDCALILILNKDDLLRKLLSSDDHGLQNIFCENKWANKTEYWDVSIDEQYKSGQMDFEQFHDYVVSFIADLFENRNNLKTRIYKHVTIATENKIVKQVFHDIQTIMVQRALKQSGYWNEDMN